VSAITVDNIKLRVRDSAEINRFFMKVSLSVVF